MEHGTHLLTTDEQALDTTFDLLRNRHRRDVVEILAEREASIPLRDLAAAVGAVKPEPESGSVSPDRTHEIAALLHHVHLPKLDDADVIDYDTETSTVAPVRTGDLVPFVRAVDGEQ
ncbi:DUF7344 domain-containing protein [Natrinema amylolyticum]|uniref:DUF7344 domain-containing protein n=1 Tax=Natrinema amylolyticum TaxID=2878679 RepID=UPI001CFAAD66|nr:hypothetical protein [Natrinema amylolyticum]